MSKKAKYHFNRETLSFEKIETTFLHLLKRIGIQLFTSICIGVVLFFVISWFVPSPIENQLKKENQELENNYNLLEKKIGAMDKVISDLRYRDNNLYRVIFQADPIETNIGYANWAEVYEELESKSNRQLLASIINRTKNLERQIYSQSISYDELFALSKRNEERLLCLPAIQPILNKDLSRVASGFGYRRDPIYHSTRFHAGMDFTAPTGTEVFATGNGTVLFAGWGQGYGNNVKINHGFNYTTLYGHLSKILVHEGQKITRGDVIGLVGSTGKSTAPHLHYEVHFKGVPQNPQNYYFLDLSPEEYDKMIQLSNNSGQVFD